MKKLLVLSALFSLLTACQHLPKTQIINTPNQTTHQQETAMTTHTITSKYNFDETVTRLKNAIEVKGMTIFASIDHQAAAKEVGLTMQPATVIVFGTPKAGTPLMIKEPTFALQLPLKVLITQVDDKVLVSFNDTKAMIDGTNIAFSEVENTLANAEKLISKTVTE